MNFSDLRPGTKCFLKVVPEKCKLKEIVVATDDGYEFSVRKLAFQRNSELPDTLACYIKESFDGHPVVQQDLMYIISEKYEKGRTYTFTIRKLPKKKNELYGVEDSLGLIILMGGAPAGLSFGKKVTARFDLITPDKVRLRYAGNFEHKSPLEFRPVSYWLENARAPHFERIFLSMLKSEEAYAGIRNAYEASNADWIFMALKTFAGEITRYLISYRNNPRRFSMVLRGMEAARNICLYIIERSDYLGNASSERRATIQKQLSGYVESFSQYSEAARMIAEQTDEASIDKMFACLKCAGYLYHPARQFRIMMTILRLRPELISPRMTELFEALQSWPMSNWLEEPFRTALVEQLEIFIRQNNSLVDNLSDSEFSSVATDSDLTGTRADSRQLNRVISAIAIQSLLVKNNDRVDMLLNRAMLYRYLTYFPGAQGGDSELDRHLYKAVEALLGNNFNTDFRWQDTAAFPMLLAKASAPVTSPLDPDSYRKVYSTADVTVELAPRSLVIRRRNATDQESKLPPNLVSWMDPRIFVSGDVPSIPAAKFKSKDLDAFRKLWAALEHNLTAEASTAVVHEQTRNYPETGDSVFVVIDRFEIDPARPEKRRLRFHATITDEYYKGEGWITSCPERLVPWLEEKDVPRNYDGGMEIFRDEQGRPLLFEARVVKGGPVCELSLKQFIDDMLRRNVTVGEESRGIIRFIDRKSNVYVVLSDNGYSLKVPFDPRGEVLGTGTVVTVRYIQEDHAVDALNLYMEGELVAASGPFYGGNSKKRPLESIFRNLAESVVETEDEDETQQEQTVQESAEVLPAEHLHQIIRMLQRRAFAEKEYLNAFNSLGLAAILARIMEDMQLYNTLKLHQELIMQLDFYARNRRINPESLESVKDEIGRHPILEKLYNRLMLVSALDDPERNPDLWKYACNGDTVERQLASLVLSYNMVDGTDDNMHRDIKGRIADILNVNSAETKLKYYGDEDQYVEFKSSLYYTNKKSDHMRANPKAQGLEILQQICGFMNSTGGTLYLGVNDFGYEAGLDDDRRYLARQNRKDSLDAIRVDLDNLVHNNLPGFATGHVRSFIDSESKKGVIRIEIDAVETPVILGDTYFVRQSTSTRPKLDKDLADFLAGRKREFDYLQRRRADALGAAAPAEPAAVTYVADDAQPTEAATAAVSEPAPVFDTPAPETAHEAPAGTGIHRRNVLHDYEAGFCEPATYLYFTADKMFTGGDLWVEEDPEYRLSLAVAEPEMKQQLIVSYDDGTTVRMDMRAIPYYTQGAPLQLPDDRRITFVNIGRRDDYLVTFFSQPSGFLAYRLDKVGSLVLTHGLKEAGKSVLPSADCSIIRQDIVTPELAEPLFPLALERSTPGAFINVRPSSSSNAPTMADIEAMLAPLAPHD